jgi:predicted Fe-Mo cluster-binding NifX family protein
MKLCIPITTNAFLESEVSGHFGKAPMYLLVESDGAEVAGLLERGERGGGQCAPVESMMAKGVDAVVCHGLGQGALARLREAGIRVYHTEGKTVSEVLTELEDGTLHEFAGEHACAGHHGQDHEHGHCH